MNAPIFSDILGFVLSAALGLSVLLRERQRPLSLPFFLFAASVGILFLLDTAAATGSMDRDGWGRLLPMLLAGGLGIRFFYLFLYGSIPPHAFRTPLLALLAAVGARAAKSLAPAWVPEGIARLAGPLFLLFCALWVLGNMALLARRTTHRAALARIQLLMAATALLVIVFPLSRHFPGANPVRHIAGNAGVLLYLYFLTQALLHQRLLDLDEVLTRLAVSSLIVAAITFIFWGMLMWLPSPGRDYLVLQLATAAVVVALLLDPLSLFAHRWIFRTLFFRRKELERRLHEIARKLDVLPTSENAAADLVIEGLMESQRVRTACLYMLSDTRPEFVRLGAMGRDFPLHVPHGNWHVLLERLQVEDLVTREDAELELERLHRGWLVSRSSFDVQAVIKALDELAADACFPLRTPEGTAGFLAVGDVARKYPFAKSELQAFMELAQKLGAVFTSLRRQDFLRRQEHLAELGRLAAGLAHEIRNPLGAIWGAVQVLESPQAQELDETARREFFQVIAQEVHRLNRVVVDFLEYARPGSAAEPPEPMELHETLHRMMPLLSAALGDVPLDFRPAPEPLRIAMDPDRLRQVLLNLLLNARDAVAGVPSPRVEMKTGRRENSVILEISDNGCGIPPDRIPQVFLPFFTTKDGGTGLGIPICVRLMESARGRLSIDSKPGRTVVLLSWPPPQP